MGNQQERLLAWLAGILDGEGTISFQVYTMPDGRVRITPFICVVNSDAGILENVAAILSPLAEKHGGKVRICGQQLRKNVVGATKPVRAIRIDGRAAAFVAGDLMPYLMSQKKDAAAALGKFQASRDAGLLQRDARGRILRKGYTRAEVELASSIRSHKSAKSSEAICSAPNVIG